MILITGGTGFIGVHVARALIDAGESVVLSKYGARAFRPSFLEDEIDKRVTIETLDTSNPHDVLDVAAKHRVDAIVHLVQSSGENSLAEEFRMNFGGLLHVLEAARQLKVRRVCMASSLNVYDGLSGSMFAEDAPVPLGRDNGDFMGTITTFKKMEEIFAGYYAARSGLEIISLRFGYVWGPVATSLTGMTRIVHAAAKGKPGPLPAPTGDLDYVEDGRDYTYVKDIAAGVQKILLAPSLQHRVYNIGTGQIVTNRMIAAAVKKIIPQAQVTLDPRTRPKPLPISYAMDSSRISNELGYAPRPLDAAIADYIAWLRAGNEW